MADSGASTISEGKRRRRGGDPYSRRPRPEISPELQRLKSGCIIQVSREQGNSPGTYVTYERECTPDELANYVWKAAEFQEQVVTSIDDAVRRSVGRVRSRDPQEIISAVIDGFREGIDPYRSIMTPLVAYKYYKVTIMPAIRSFAYAAAEEALTFEEEVRSNALGDMDALDDLTDDRNLIDALRLWFGDQAYVEVVDAPMDLMHFVVEPGAFVLDAAEHEYYHDKLRANKHYPIIDKVSDAVALDRDVDPGEFDSILALYDYLYFTDMPMQAEANPTTVTDETKWKRAVEIVEGQRGPSKEFSSLDWGLVNHIYQQMGGEFKAKRGRPRKTASPRMKASRKTSKSRKNPDEYTTIDLATYEMALIAARECGIDNAATQDGGFADQFREANGQFNKLPEDVRKARNNTVARVYGRYSAKGEEWLTDDGCLSRGALILATYAYSPVPTEELKAALEAGHYGD